jgi:FKBP-type peptidyl-prolyl cis-trans isomerase FkpA
MKKIFIYLIMFVVFVQYVPAQTIKRYPSGIEAKTIKAGKVVKKARVGDMINTVIEGKYMGQVLFTTKKMNKGLPVNFKVEKPKFRGDVMEGILQMNEGDSTVFYIPADSFFRGNRPPNAKPGEKVIYNVKINWIKTPADIAKEQKAYDDYMKQQAVQKKQMAKMMADQKKAQAAAALLVKKDKEAIAKFVIDNGIQNVKTTSSGLSYAISKEGEGETVPNGKQVVMNYTGRLLDGTPFDSNLDSTFGHVQPLSFVLGTGRVIRGWDEGIAFLKKGSVAKLLIPSGLGYGPNSQGKIPANANLIFDVEVVDFMDPPPPPPPTPTTPAKIESSPSGNIQAPVLKAEEVKSVPKIEDVEMPVVTEEAPPGGHVPLKK